MTTEKITMFKPGAPLQYDRALEDYDGMTVGNLDSVLVQPFSALCRELKIDTPPTFEPVEQRLTVFHQQKRIVVAHGERASLHQPAAALAVWSALCQFQGRAYIISPYARTWFEVCRLVSQLVALMPVIARELVYGAYSIHLRKDAKRRIEWVHPVAFSPGLLKEIAGCSSFVFVDGAEHCANGFLEALSASVYVGQPLLVTGVPVAAGGGFEALFNDEGAMRLTLSAYDAPNEPPR
ncbi:hypothetical protein CYR55_22480 [Chimaeribacter californicus]|uniref:Uncharacterized protein n=1 Tax=Chimaeribacter californicus TaxID=2060067 RepID=A0A2N5DTW6_9GAMM|nr:hypothetical protein [Chimaeribacter californicus]PLR30047.1 hypothetical protein CYR55_22480 [Chimaeribacter californicus]